MNSEKIKFTGNTKSFKIIKSKAVRELLQKEFAILSNCIKKKKKENKKTDEIQFH